MTGNAQTPESAVSAPAASAASSATRAAASPGAASPGAASAGAASAGAASTGAASAAAASAAAASAPAAVPPAHILRANRLIPLRFEETLVSGVNAPGSLFRMQVTDDIVVDDQVVIPAGTVALGEVIDSQKAGMLGKAGVLVLSARYVHLDQRDIRLHSALGAAGASNTAALVVPFLRGKDATIEQGTRVVVRTVNDESF
jgi:hypothetical protein